MTRWITIALFGITLAALALPLATIRARSTDDPGLRIRYQTTIVAFGATSRLDSRRADLEWDLGRDAAADALTSRQHHGGLIVLAVLVGLGGAIRGRRGALLGIAGAAGGIAALLWFRTYNLGRVEEARHVLGDSVVFELRPGWTVLLVGLSLAGIWSAGRLARGEEADASLVPSDVPRQVWIARVALGTAPLIGVMLIPARLASSPPPLGLVIAAAGAWTALCVRSYRRWRRGAIPTPVLLNVSVALFTIVSSFILALLAFSTVRTLL